MPLDTETKLKSQAAVEMVGGHLGKGGGSMLITLLTSVIYTGTNVHEPAVMRIIMVVFTVVMVAWLVAVYGINPRVERKLAEKRKEEEAAKLQTPVRMI